MTRIYHVDSTPTGRVNMSGAPARDHVDASTDREAQARANLAARTAGAWKTNPSGAVGRDDDERTDPSDPSNAARVDGELERLDANGDGSAEKRSAERMARRTASRWRTGDAQ